MRAMRILVCLDGEAHTRAAIERAIDLAAEESAELVGLHVIDEWLRQFSSEIYAQGRKEYLDWVDQCLAENAAAVREAFVARCHARNVAARFVLRDGDRAAEIVAAVDELHPDLVVAGGKNRSRWETLRSARLTARLRRACGNATPIEIVTAATGHATSLPSETGAVA